MLLSNIFLPYLFPIFLAKDINHTSISENSVFTVFRKTNECGDILIN